jgi:hypothetical protein
MRLTTARLSTPKNTRTANWAESRVTVRQMARTAQSRAVPPLHPVTHSQNRRSALPGVRVGCQLIVLPHALSQMANTCAQPRATPSGQTNLASEWPVRIITFGDQAPGASAGIPLRCAEVAVTGSKAGADLVGQARLMSSYVHALQDFYGGARIQAVQLAGGQHVVQIGFTAPSPLGWVSTSAS